MIALPAADLAPTFSAGNRQVIATCENTTALAINAALSATDADIAQTETWFINAVPLHGSLSGFPASTLSTGGVITPAGLSYTPGAGFSGIDSFEIGITDGTDSAFTTVVITINPLPVFTSTLTPPGICTGSLFSYSPASSSAGAAFSWHRVFVPGISNPTASGTGNPGETLYNVTYYDITTTYLYTVTAGGCSNQADVSVTVHPIPTLSGSLHDTVCSGSTFNYTPSGTIAGTVFTWSRAVVAGVTPATASSGMGVIHEVLTDDSTDTVTTRYTFLLTANGCSSTRDLDVTLIPQPTITTITTASPATVCSGTNYQNFGAGIAPPAGMSYAWSAENAIIWAVGSTSQYALVNFPDTGSASVVLTISGAATHCLIYDTFAVHVSSNVSDTGSVIFYNYQLIFRDNTQSSYQWGYDNIYTLAATIIPGATFQSYPILSPDFIDNDYWVLTTKNGCMQKTYLNAPHATGVATPGKEATFSVMPNPASGIIYLLLNATPAAGMTMELTDITGHMIKTEVAVSARMQMDVSELPAGCYLVSLVQNGMKTMTSRVVVTGK